MYLLKLILSTLEESDEVRRTGNLNGDTYLDLLENTIIPALIEIMENDQRYQEENAIFQQDGAPPHYALPNFKLNRKGACWWDRKLLRRRCQKKRNYAADERRGDETRRRRRRRRIGSATTIRRRVLASGLRCKRALRVPLLTARHHNAQLQWAGAHHDWLLPQRRNVLFSDESRFGLVSNDYRERVWRERGGQNRLATAIDSRRMCAEDTPSRLKVLWPDNSLTSNLRRLLSRAPAWPEVLK
nr:unnamed protein product [Callosobruchus chinensis]